jgi:hypothetical protein
LRRHLAWLKESGEPLWIEGLRADLREARRLLSIFPEIGTIETRKGTLVLRRFVLAKTPYVFWFVRDTEVAKADVWLVRLFHERQRRPRPRVTLVGK